MRNAAGPSQREKITAKVYAVMGVTSAMTFVTLKTGYQLFFAYTPFA